MEPSSASKPGPLRGVLARLLLSAVLALLLRFAYVVAVSGSSCSSADFCFFSAPAAGAAAGGAGGGGGGTASALLSSSSSPALWSTREWRRSTQFYSSIFTDLVAANYLSPASKALCIGTAAGYEVLALKEIGVSDAVGLHRKPSPPLVVAGDPLHHPFSNDTFDFIFAGRALEQSPRPATLAAEIARVLKTEGYLAILTASAGDMYSLHSLSIIFPFFRNVRQRDIADNLREILLQKEEDSNILGSLRSSFGSGSKCNVAEHKMELLRKTEPLIKEEPLKPWITLKKNINNIKYLPSVADISFKQRYVYVDVGARSYGSSIGSWFRKQYPKQNHTFEVYAIEADKEFHHEYSTRKGVTLLPYAAWVRNETLSFEVNHNHDQKSDEKGGRGMGRIRSAGSSSSVGDSHQIQGFDFAEWLKSTVTERDYVVMKMDVEGTEFDLVPRLFETGAICLIDELFLECHYNRWQRCCPGERSPKYQYTYGQCLDLFSSLRDSGVLVHQWW